MHKAELALRKSAVKIAKWYRGKVLFQHLPNGTGFVLRLAGDAEVVPTIGVNHDQLIGAQDDFDIFLDLLGYEAQVERVLFDPERRRFILDAGWSGKFWRKDQPGQDFTVDTIGIRLPSKISVMAVILIAAVKRERVRRLLPW